MLLEGCHNCRRLPSQSWKRVPLSYRRLLSHQCSQTSNYQTRISQNFCGRRRGGGHIRTKWRPCLPINCGLDLAAKNKREMLSKPPLWPQFHHITVATVFGQMCFLYDRVKPKMKSAATTTKEKWNGFFHCHYKWCRRLHCCCSMGSLCRMKIGTFRLLVGQHHFSLIDAHMKIIHPCFSSCSHPKEEKKWWNR